MEQAIKKSLLLRSTVYKSIEPGLLSSLSLLAEQNGLEAKQLAAAFDKFMTVARQDSTAVTAEDVQAFAGEQAKAAAATKVRTENLFNKGSWDDVVIDASHDEAAQPPSQRITPYMNKAAPRSVSTVKRHATPASSGKFKERTQSGAVQAALNAAGLQQPDFTAAMEVDDTPEVSRCGVEVLGQPVEVDARYMVNRIEDMAAYLERRINALEVEVQACCGEGAPHPVATASQQETYFVGRICCDTEEGRLNPQSVLLEGSAKVSQGNRVRLDLSACPDYRLFPGQVVAVRGTNPSGFCVVAAEIVPGTALPQRRTPVAELVELTQEAGGRGRSYVVAAGPFTTSEDLAYEPLAALLEYCATHRPDVLVLLGPFVDVEHPLVRDGTLDETFEEVYASRVAVQLAEFTEREGVSTRVVLVPSTRDAHHDPVLPQPPLPACVGAATLANPATFACDEVVVGCCSADWLMACTKEEVSKAAGQVDRLPALASHLITQRSFFPMFPAPLGTPLDASMARALDMPCTPDILVVPSELAPFAKLLPVPPSRLGAAGGSPTAADAAATVVCVNPGKLTKGTTGGTFAHITVSPHPEALRVLDGNPAATNAAIPHQVAARCSVQVKKV